MGAASKTWRLVSQIRQEQLWVIWYHVNTTASALNNSEPLLCWVSALIPSANPSRYCPRKAGRNLLCCRAHCTPLVKTAQTFWQRLVPEQSSLCDSTVALRSLVPAGRLLRPLAGRLTPVQSSLYDSTFVLRRLFPAGRLYGPLAKADACKVLPVWLNLCVT